ncbi:GntR family transcriptional regulator [Streptomyces tricolor]
MTGVPLKHQRIGRILATEIRTGGHPAGERLPGEHALAARFGVSRTTIRAALAELTEQGLITTRTGKGSYVVFDGRPPDDRPGRARALALRDVDSTVRTLAVREIRDSALAAGLGLEKDAFVCVERTRERVPDGTVLSYERTFLPPVPGVRELPARGLGQEPLAEVLRRAGLRPDHGEQRGAGHRIDAREAGLLRRAPGDWFLAGRRPSRAADGSFVEHVVSLLDPDHFELTVAFG